MSKELEKLILKYALQNAVLYKGKANLGAVIGKVLAENPNLKKKIQEVKRYSKAVVNDVNSLSLEEQREKLQKIDSGMLKKSPKKEKSNIFSMLKIHKGKIKTAFPPGPEKYPHIGHAKTLLLNYMLAKQYKGKFILRFEDTNPALVKKEFYKIMLDNFSWLGVTWDELQYASDNMELFYNMAEKTIQAEKAYMCFCSQEKVKESRAKGSACECRNKPAKKNLTEWNNFRKLKEGEAILRLKIDLKHKNSTMRDPTIFRIVDEKHARRGTKYRVWPNYDFQNAIMDGYYSITNRIRSKEFEMRSELQRYIQKLLNLEITETYEIGRFNMPGVVSSGRIIREKIKNEELIGWDDPSLTTLVALKRRGFVPEAIKNFVLSTGITKTESTTSWDDLIIHNRRILDNSAGRYFFLHNPVKVKISGAPERKLNLHLNPNKKTGGRTFSVKDEFYISKSDKPGEVEVVRLMENLNFKVKGRKLTFHSTEYENFREQGKKIIHWLPVEGNVKVEILMPDKKVVKGIAEHNIKNLKTGDIIQFERFGFCRLDKISKGKFYFWFTHR